MTFNITYADGTATRVGLPDTFDYSNAVTTLSFGAEDRTKDVTIAITDDSLVEGNETFTVSIATDSLPPGFTLGNVTTTVTITDNDSAQLLLQRDVKAAEGSGTFEFEVISNKSSDIDITFDYKVATKGGDTATVDVDFIETTRDSDFVSECEKADDCCHCDR